MNYYVIGDYFKVSDNSDKKEFGLIRPSGQLPYVFNNPALSYMRIGNESHALFKVTYRNGKVDPELIKMNDIHYEIGNENNIPASVFLPGKLVEQITAAIQEDKIYE